MLRHFFFFFYRHNLLFILFINIFSEEYRFVWGLRFLIFGGSQQFTDWYRRSYFKLSVYTYLWFNEEFGPWLVSPQFSSCFFSRMCGFQINLPFWWRTWLNFCVVKIVGQVFCSFWLPTVHHIYFFSPSHVPFSSYIEVVLHILGGHQRVVMLILYSNYSTENTQTLLQLTALSARRREIMNSLHNIVNLVIINSAKLTNYFTINFEDVWLEYAA